METSAKHFRFVNTKTDNVIYYYSVDYASSSENLKETLNAIKAQVATSNGLDINTLYWEEVREEEKNN
ncbi:MULTISPECIES: hypothetical protein [unclassified Mucilaginibacter]|uniref:hypothetical protein n=1 Tax=unclassified Mucilaginibacter TaxID=2617802 RepID=UPI0031F6F9E3